MLDNKNNKVYLGHMHNKVLNLKLNPADFKRYRLERDWTMEQMANFLQISVASVYQYENGRKPQDRIAARILRMIPELGRTACSTWRKAIYEHFTEYHIKRRIDHFLDCLVMFIGGGALAWLVATAWRA